MIAIRNTAIILAVAAILAGCENNNTLAVTTLAESTSLGDEALIKAFLGEQTRDPEAARVRNLTTYRLNNGDRAICGEFNGKNAYGGYVGYSAFYVRLRDQVIRASQWGEYQSVAARQSCAEAATGNLMIQPDP